MIKNFIKSFLPVFASLGLQMVVAFINVGRVEKNVIWLFLEFIIFSYWYYKINNKFFINFDTKIPINRVASITITAITLSIFSLLFINAYSKIFNIIPESQINADGLLALVWCFLAVIVGPVIEELLFRGLIYERLRTIIPIPAAIVCQSIVFGLMHGAIYRVCYAIVLGLVFGFVREKTDCLEASILMHVAYNLSTVMLSAETFDLPPYISIVFCVVLLFDIIIILRKEFIKNAV